MPSGNDCPGCDESIGIGAVFKAPVPNRIYCPHCGARLRYGDTDLLIATAVLLLIAVLGVSIILAFVLDSGDPLLFGAVLIGVLVFGGIVLEIAFVLVLWYGSYRLESVSEPKSEWEDEAF